MKNYIKIYILFISIFLLTGCSNDDDANDSSKYEGIFIGEVYFSDGNNEINWDIAEVEVIKVGESYEISFPGEIPNLVDVEYEDHGSALLNIDASEDNFVRITDITLQVNYTDNEGRYWKANCER